MTYLHKIKAQLYDNTLTDDPNDLMTQFSSSGNPKHLLKESRTAFFEKALTVL